MSATYGGNRSPTTTSTHCTRRASRTVCSTSTGGRSWSVTAWAGSAPLPPMTRPTPPTPAAGDDWSALSTLPGTAVSTPSSSTPSSRNALGRTGVGRGLLSVAERESRAAGCEWLHVDFEEDLRGFYLGACGFRRRRPASSPALTLTHERPYPFGVLFLGIAALEDEIDVVRVAPTTPGPRSTWSQSNSYQSGI